MSRIQGTFVALALGGVCLLASACAREASPPPAENEPAPTAESTAPETSAPSGSAAAAPVTPAPSPPRAGAPAPSSPKTAPPAAEPAPAPAPEPVVKTVPAGTALDLEFTDGVSTATSAIGDTFRARVVKDVAFDGIVVVPAGSTVTGTVTDVKGLDKKIGGKARLALSFDSLTLPWGESAKIQAAWSMEGKSETAKDAATIGGAAAAGAILGRAVAKKDDKKDGTAIGAVVGAAAGTAIAAKTKGEEIELGAGAPISVVLEASTVVRVPR